MEIKTVGVVGCGIMGSGITQVCAQAGYQVIVSEINDQVLNKGIKSIDAVLSRSVDKGKISQQDKDAILGRIKGTTNMADFAACDLMIEAAPEEMELKKNVFAQLDKICPKHTILASNTSVLSIADIGSATDRPDQVLGTHFSNPVPVARILEMVRSIATSDATVATTKSFGESIGKTVVVCKDMPGFISNRIFTSFLLNAIRVVESGIAETKDIDTVFTMGAGHAMGPLATLDLIGIDTVLKGASAIYEELKDPQYAPPPLMRRMVAAGWLGRKSGKGFYEY
jgi:3-hydroxybutyryl-CoA dehydrogenase